MKRCIYLCEDLGVTHNEVSVMCVKGKNALTASVCVYSVRRSRPAEGKAKRGVVEPPTLAEDSVLSLPMEGKAGSGMGATPSQLAPPKGVEGGNLLLPALNSQDGVIHEDSNRRTPKSVSPDVNA